MEKEKRCKTCEHCVDGECRKDPPVAAMDKKSIGVGTNGSVSTVRWLWPKVGSSDMDFCSYYRPHLVEQNTVVVDKKAAPAKGQAKPEPFKRRAVNADQ